MYGRRTILVKKGVNVLNWLDKLERKFGRYAIPNLTVYLLQDMSSGLRFIILHRICLDILH